MLPGGRRAKAALRPSVAGSGRECAQAESTPETHLCPWSELALPPPQAPPPPSPELACSRRVASASSSRLPRSILCAKEMSASEIQGNEASKDTNVRKIGQSGLRIRIRLPPRKRSDSTKMASTGVPEDSENENLTEKNMPEQTDNNIQSTIRASAEVKAEEANSNPAGVLEDAKNLSAKEVPKQIDNNTQRMICAAAEVKSEDASSNLPEVPEDIENLTEKNMLEQTDNNAQSMICVASEVKAEEANSNPAGVLEDTKNLSAKEEPKQTDNNTEITICGTAELKAEEASSNPPGVPVDTKSLSAKEVPKQTDNHTRSSFSMSSKLMVEEVNSSHAGEGSDNHIRSKESSSNIENETLSRDTPPEKLDFIAPSRNPATSFVVQGKEESSYHVTMRLCEEGNKNILGKELSPENSCSTPVNKSCTGVTDENKTLRKNLASTGVYVEVEKNYSVTGPCEDASNNVLSNRLLCEKNCNTSSKSLSGEPRINCPSKNLTTSALKSKETNENPVRTSQFEARNYVTTEKLSAEARKNALSRRPAVPANAKTSKKRLRSSVAHSTDTCKNTSGMKSFPSVVQAVEQSSSDANLEAIKVYKEFEEKVRRTVYLDNMSHLATETVINMALNQFGTVRNVNFLINYTVPYDIPQSALVEMETEKDAESVVSMLHEFPFMMSGMPRPVRVQRATAVMFNDRPRKPGGKLEFHWVRPTDPDYHNVRKFKIMSKRHEVENLALIKLELEGEKLLAKQQQDDLDCNYRKLETVDTVVTTGRVGRLSHIYNMRFNEAF
ncbi:hypothetical protein PR202_ga30442 [Eleusine coracana subsp. coracana]|uniref:RRM domain-containing protein n=1 Tax=Eleusine coracana subsp. coracana TaxID=191504 RepID=A0AAV5DNY9_ELECO|nr:hypothetical protein PR202_ga30442 [Eleusine coracana subsp. coracana]